MRSSGSSRTQAISVLLAATLTGGRRVAGIELAAFVKNISDANRELFVYDFISAAVGRLLTYSPPRWWGLSVRKEF